MRLAPGTEPVRVEWYFADPGAKYLGLPTPFHSAVWDGYIPPDPDGLGEVRRYYRKVDNRYYPKEPGLCYMGTRQQWRNGLSPADLAAPPPPRPRCCLAFWELGGFVGGGYTTADGRPAFPTELVPQLPRPLFFRELRYPRFDPSRMRRPFLFEPVLPPAEQPEPVPLRPPWLPRRAVPTVRRPLAVLAEPFFPQSRPAPMARLAPPYRRPLAPPRHLGVKRFPFPLVEVVQGERPLPVLHGVFAALGVKRLGTRPVIRSTLLVVPDPVLPGLPAQVYVQMESATDNACDCEPFRVGVFLDRTNDDPDAPEYELNDPLGSAPACEGLLSFVGDGGGNWTLRYRGPISWSNSMGPWDGTTPVVLTIDGGQDQAQCTNYPATVTVYPVP